MWFEGGRIDAVARSGRTRLRTSEGASTRVGVAQVRRAADEGALALEHVLFAPIEPRPLLLSCVTLENRSDAPLRVDYTELWDVTGREVRAEPGACVCDAEAGRRALADASIAIRGEAPQPLPARGLALELRLGLAPRARRELAFAYVAPGPNEDPGWLVQAWRGEVHAALERTVSAWLARLAGTDDPIEAYRRAAEGAHEAAAEVQGTRER